MKPTIALASFVALIGCNPGAVDPAPTASAGPSVQPVEASASALASASASTHAPLLASAGEPPTAVSGAAPDVSEPDYSAKAPPRGNMWGDDIGDAGWHGLKGSGGPADAEGIGTMSRGSSRSGKPPSVRMGSTNVVGRLPPEVIQRIVRQNFGRFRLCYENGLRADPTLHGKVSVSFVIGIDGSVSGVSATADFADKGVPSCITRAFQGLVFPKPEGGVVKVTYPILFTPGDAPAPSPTSASEPTVSGKLLAQVTSLEVERALRDAGYTDISSAEVAGLGQGGGVSAVVFKAKKGGRAFTVTFVAANARTDALGPAEKQRLLKDAETFSSGTFFLAVESNDKTASQTLLGELIKKS